MDASLVAIGGSNVTKQDQHAIVVGRETDSVNFHLRSSHQNESTGRPEVKRPFGPRPRYQKTIREERRTRCRMSTTLKRFPLSQKVPTHHLQCRPAKALMAGQPSYQAFRHRIPIPAATKTRTPLLPRTSGSRYRHL